MPDFDPEQQIMMVLFAACSSWAEEQVAMIGYPIDHACFAGPANALGARVVCRNTGIEHRVEDRLARLDHDRAVAARQPDLEPALEGRGLPWPENTRHGHGLPAGRPWPFRKLRASAPGRSNRDARARGVCDDGGEVERPPRTLVVEVQMEIAMNVRPDRIEIVEERRRPSRPCRIGQVSTGVRAPPDGGSSTSAG